MSQGPPLAVVLVEPAGPLNVGGVARVCANFGVTDLRLVAPRCSHLGEEARRMAVHGVAVLQSARLFPSLAAALADCRRVVATSGRRCGEPLPLQGLDGALGWLGEDVSAAGAGQHSTAVPRALVFGREDRGLSNAELLQAGRLLSIDTASTYGSLNLAQAAAVVLHHWHRLQTGSRQSAGASDCSPPSGPGPEPCPRAALEAMLGDAERLLLEVGFLYPHTAAARMAKLRALLQRAQVGSEEAALLRGMVRQLRWAQTRGGTGTREGDDPAPTP
ncbi:RNA methyltransferase [Cyanobium sp. ATX 6A2]|uniref:RNA methyltransferase n=1 Tax=Cyanobium sp. ATX 6A2 TaxID=2823700 RepID=UPI0020CD5AD1|nr:RNA methyltransferase [Cyanobium sp. ATX 6A2]